MKTSITTILWGKIHTLGKFRSVITEAKEIGYEGVGLETRHLPLQAIRNPLLVKKTLAEVGIENAGSYSTMKPKDVGWAAKAGTPLLWVVARGDRTFDNAAKSLAELASLAARSGVGIALHNHLGTRFETEAQMGKVLSQNKELNVCLDTAHAEAAGFDSVRFIHEYGERVSLVHLKDLRRRVPKGRVSFTKDFVNVGDGIVDFGKVFGALRDVGYPGSLMLEIEALGDKRPGELAREGFDRIQRMLREA
jgi:sugar phosphate isomerase/epimerase